MFCFQTHIVGGTETKTKSDGGEGIRQGDPQTWPFRNDPLPSIHPRLGQFQKKNSLTGVYRRRRGNNVKCSGGSDVSKFLLFVSNRSRFSHVRQSIKIRENDDMKLLTFFFRFWNGRIKINQTFPKREENDKRK